MLVQSFDTLKPVNPNLHYLEAQALALLNTPYKWGGASPLEGLDCSGLCVYLLKSIGYIPETTDATAQSLFTLLSNQKYKTTTEFGAFAFYGASKQSINHVAFVMSERLIIEAMGDSSVTDFSKAMGWRNHQGALVRLSPLKRRLDLVAIVRPIYQCLGE